MWAGPGEAELGSRSPHGSKSGARSAAWSRDARGRGWGACTAAAWRLVSVQTEVGPRLRKSSPVWVPSGPRPTGPWLEVPENWEVGCHGDHVDSRYGDSSVRRDPVVEEKPRGTGVLSPSTPGFGFHGNSVRVCVCVGGVSPSCLGWSLEQGVRLGKGVACFHGDSCCTEGWVAVGSFKEGGFRGGGSGWGQPKEL